MTTWDLVKEAIPYLPSPYESHHIYRIPKQIGPKEIVLEFEIVRFADSSKIWQLRCIEWPSGEIEFALPPN